MHLFSLRSTGETLNSSGVKDGGAGVGNDLGNKPKWREAASFGLFSLFYLVFINLYPTLGSNHEPKPTVKIMK